MQCWGENSSGQLGNNSTTNATTPVIVADITTAIAVSTGGSHTCALLSTGVSKCWGANNFGQLGNNVIPISRIAILVPEMTSGITHLGTGASYACASIQDPAVTPKSIQCLGDNEFGQLGNGTENGTNIPVAVSGISTASAVAVGRFHACALLSAPGNIKCWGANDHGKLGNGDTTIISTSTPVDVIGISTATSVSAGNNHTCAVLNDTGAGGSVSCWGDGLSGQRGDGTTEATSTPVSINLTDISTAVSVSAGEFHTCALLFGGAIKCWGKNDFGQLGNGTGSSNTPVLVLGINTAIAISAGGSHTCALLLGVGGGVQCWGGNSKGQLGDGASDPLNPVPHPTPIPVTDLPPAAFITSGVTHTCASLTDNRVKCWGDNDSGQLGDESTSGFSDVPVFVKEKIGSVSVDLSSVSAVSAGGSDIGGKIDSHTCARISNGTMKCWGNGALGQIGSGLKLFESIPVSVQGLSN